MFLLFFLRLLHHRYMKKGKTNQQEGAHAVEANTHRPTTNFESTQARHDHPRPKTTSNRGTPTSRACSRISHQSVQNPKYPKTYVWRKPRSAESALISLSRRSRRSPLQAEVAILLLGDKSDDDGKLSFLVGVSGSTQLNPAECRLAEAMSRLLMGSGGGVDGASSTTMISGTSGVVRDEK